MKDTRPGSVANMESLQGTPAQSSMSQAQRQRADDATESPDTPDANSLDPSDIRLQDSANEHSATDQHSQVQSAAAANKPTLDPSNVRIEPKIRGQGHLTNTQQLLSHPATHDASSPQMMSQHPSASSTSPQQHQLHPDQPNSNHQYHNQSLSNTNFNAS